MPGPAEDSIVAPRSSFRILVAEDDKLLRRRLIDVLERFNGRTTAARDGLEAVSYLRQETFEVLLTDIEMPSLNGFALVKACREASPETVPVIMTAHADLETSLRALRLGAYDFLVKPFSDELLRATVSRALEKKALAEENIRLIEDLREANAELLQKNTLLEKIHLELTEKQRLYSVGLLAAGVAHEINNPLSAISTYVQLLHQKLDPSNGSVKDPEKVVQDLGRFLPRIRQDIERIEKIVNSLLIFSRRQEFTMRPDDLNHMLQEVIELAGYHLSGSGISIRWELSRDLPRAMIDRGRIAEAVMNLIFNAVQAMPKGGELTLTTRPDPENPAYLQLLVADTGEGISEKSIAHIFDPFYSTRGPGAGTGLGLAVAHELIRKHRGDIRVRNLPEKGTVFEIGLPAAD